MSPAKFYGDEDEKKAINGPRPAPLRISKGSEIIKKQSFLNSHSLKNPTNEPNRDQQKPVIIYAHSPKIIHTKPHDFMALVQKLTGLSRPEKDEKNYVCLAKEGEIELNEIKDEVPSPPKRENYQYSSSLLSPSLPNNPFLTDMPLFTPGSANFFFSPRTLYRYGDSASPLPNMTSPKLPSMIEPKKEVQQYRQKMR